MVFEFKTAIQENTTIHDAYVQLTTRYKRDIPELFKYNAFCVISDGVNTKAGSFFAPYEFFYAWRKIEGMVTEVDGIDAMFTLIQGMFHRNRLRDIIHNFIYSYCNLTCVSILFRIISLIFRVKCILHISFVNVLEKRAL